MYDRFRILDGEGLVDELRQIYLGLALPENDGPMTDEKQLDLVSSIWEARTPEYGRKEVRLCLGAAYLFCTDAGSLAPLCYLLTKLSLRLQGTGAKPVRKRGLSPLHAKPRLPVSRGRRT